MWRLVKSPNVRKFCTNACLKFHNLPNFSSGKCRHFPKFFAIFLALRYMLRHNHAMVYMYTLIDHSSRPMRTRKIPQLFYIIEFRGQRFEIRQIFPQEQIMTTNETGTICGLPQNIVGIPRNDTVAYINDILLGVANGSFAAFAFFSNLAIIVAVVKNPSLQKPCNILLCSLATADCLTGITAQPMFVAWRFFLQRAQRSCLHQFLIFEVYHTFNVLAVGLSFTNVVIISFDRCFALSRPLVYRANATNQGKGTRLPSLIHCCKPVGKSRVYQPTCSGTSDTSAGGCYCWQSKIIINV